MKTPEEIDTIRRESIEAQRKYIDLRRLEMLYYESALNFFVTGGSCIEYDNLMAKMFYYREQAEYMVLTCKRKASEFGDALTEE